MEQQRDNSPVNDDQWDLYRIHQDISQLIVDIQRRFAEQYGDNVGTYRDLFIRTVQAAMQGYFEQRGVPKTIQDRFTLADNDDNQRMPAESNIEISYDQQPTAEQSARVRAGLDQLKAEDLSLTVVIVRLKALSQALSDEFGFGVKLKHRVRVKQADNPYPAANAIRLTANGQILKDLLTTKHPQQAFSVATYWRQEAEYVVDAVIIGADQSVKQTLAEQGIPFEEKKTSAEDFLVVPAINIKNDPAQAAAKLERLGFLGAGSRQPRASSAAADHDLQALANSPG